MENVVSLRIYFNAAAIYFNVPLRIYFNVAAVYFNVAVIYGFIYAYLFGMRSRRVAG
jgi:hypothetical protein